METESVYSHHLPGTRLPHQQSDMACTQMMPFVPALPGSTQLKRNRSGTFQLSPSSTMQSQHHQLQSAIGDGRPPAKRVKVEGVTMPRFEEQAQSATQEQSITSVQELMPPSSTVAAHAVAGSAPHPQVVFSAGEVLSTLPSASNTDTKESAGQNQVASPVATSSSSHAARPALAPDSCKSLTHPMRPASSKMLSVDTKSPAYRLSERDRIKFEFDQMILQKHDEARLIEQEQAKAQIALEQLRRCRHIPFPGQPGSAVTHDQMLDSQIPSLPVPAGHAHPSHPAGWGVTDGPYTRHYAKWLIPDSQFDSEPVSRQQRQSTGGQSDVKSWESGGSHRRQRHSTGGRSEVPNVDRPQPPPKEKNEVQAPQIMTRTDGQKVQLKCRECGQMVFKSVQGFMNHVRIQHAVRIRSHKEAANEWGVPVDNDTASVQPSTPIPTAQVTTFAFQPVAGQVHPMNTVPASQAKPRGGSSGPSMADLMQFSPLNPNFQREKPRGTGFADVKDGSKMDGIVPSVNLPALSALAQKTGGFQNLQQLYTHASQKVDLSSIQPLIPDSEVEEDSPEEAPGSEWRKPPIGNGQVTGARAPISGARSQQRPPSIVVPSTGNVNSLSVPAGYEWSSSPAPSADGTIDTPMHDLSPHANPPGLVTDEDEDEEMEDEIRSVVEQPQDPDSQRNVQIVNVGGEGPMNGVGCGGVELLQWQPRSSCEQQSLPMVAPQGAQEKKRRGRPSKKGKEKGSK